MSIWDDDPVQVEEVKVKRVRAPLTWVPADNLIRVDLASAIRTWINANKLGPDPQPGRKRNHDCPETNAKRARMEAMLALLEGKKE